MQLQRLLVLTFSLLCGSAAAIDAPVWQQFHGADGRHSGASDATIVPAQIAERWKADPAVIGTGSFNRPQTPCVSADGSIVVAYADNNPYTSGAGKLVAFDAFTGAVKWTLAVSASNDNSSYSSATFRNGYFYWAGSDAAGTSKVYKIHAQSGSTAANMGGWMATLPGNAGIVNVSPLVTDDLVFITTWAFGGPSFSGPAEFFALEVSSGATRWTAPDAGSGQTTLAYDESRDLVYGVASVGFSYFVRAYDAQSGAIAWTAPWSLTNFPSACGITLVNDKLYIQDYAFSGNGKVYVADAANQGAQLLALNTKESGGSCVTVDPSGNFYVYTSFPAKGKAQAFNAIGTARWPVDVNGDSFIEGGGWNASPAWADGHVFIGQQNGNNLHIVNDTNGAIVRTIPGSGPVSFGERTFFTAGFDGKLYAYSTSSDFATEVVSSTNLVTAFNDPNSALGRPSVDAENPDGDVPFDWPVVPVYPAQSASQVVGLSTGGSIVLKFDHRVKRDPHNPYGADLIVFGNTLYGIPNSGVWTNGNPSSTTVTAGGFYEEGKVSVSQDGTTWVEVPNTFADSHAPTLGRVFDPNNTVPVFTGNMWWSVPTDATLALDPGITAASFAGQSVAQVAMRYGQSAGGTSVKLSDVSLDWIQFIKIEHLGALTEFPDVDAISDARIVADTIAPPQATGLNIAAAFTSAQVAWTNPASSDVAGVIVVRRSGAPSAVPSAGIGRYKGTAQGGGTVVYAGTGSSFSDTGLDSGTLYYYSVFTFDPMLNYSLAVTASTMTGNNPPSMSSGAGASPTTVFQNGSVTFSAAATDADSDPLTYTWAFGDGGFATGASAVHSFTQPGSYTVTVTVTDGKGGQAQSSITINVVINPNDVDGDGIPNGTDLDSDADGVPDTIEVALGTDPLSAASSPAGGTVVGGGARVSVITKTTIKLNFASGKDRITVNGGIPVNGGVILSAKPLSIYVGGAGATVTLGKNGAGGDRQNKVRVRAKSNVLGPQTVTFSATLNGTFAKALADEGLTGDASISNSNRTVLLAVIFDGKLYTQTQVLRYSARAGKSGSAK